MAIVASAEAGIRAAPRATVLQLRAPRLDASDLELAATRLVGAVGIPVVVSSRCDVALAAGAAGVNLPERDIPTRDARRLLGDRILGRSVHSLDAALEAEQEDADYVIFGPVWGSSSHPDVEPKGLEALSEIAHRLEIPVLAVGGVTEERVDSCLRAGAAGFAAIRLFE